MIILLIMVTDVKSSLKAYHIIGFYYIIYIK